MRRRILLIGGTGQVGVALRACSWPSDIELVAPTRADLDLGDTSATIAYVARGRFCAVVNAAAYTAVDKAESEVVAAWKVNALAPAAIASATKNLGIPIVHISTDYVFDGLKNEAYLEDDPVAPLGVYGASKEGGEQAVRTGNPRHAIIRTAWLFSSSGANFLTTMLRKGAENAVLNVVDDQRGCPTAALDLAKALQVITLRLVNHPDAPFGTYNFVNAGEATWYDFAVEIFRQQSRMGFKVPELKPIKTSEYPTAARRPGNSTLSNAKVARDFGIASSHWKDALTRVLTAQSESVKPAQDH
ncbi:dTDP-4-dehydrorhamnose reductase [Ensifer sp. MJa1]